MHVSSRDRHQEPECNPTRTPCDVLSRELIVRMSGFVSSPGVVRMVLSFRGRGVLSTELVVATMNGMLLLSAASRKAFRRGKTKYE